LLERKKILSDIVRRIVSNEDDRSARDNSAIARIANPDLSGETQQLVNEYGDNDDAIFFLGRLVWQGEMASCVEPFVDIALDSTRGIYARRVSARAVMTCGSVGQKQRLWQKLNGNDAQIPRELLSELVEDAKPDNHSVKHLLISLGKLPPYKRLQASGLGLSLHQFVERLPIVDDQQAVTQLLDGLYTYFEKPPYVERRECRVSEEYAWLLSPATHAIKRLVEARSSVAFGKRAISIMLMVPALRYWNDNDLSEHEGNLQALVPDWPELNDALYWISIEQARTAEAAKSSELLTDIWSVSWLGHFWNFDTNSLPRLLEFMSSRPLQDDRLIALSTAVRVYAKIDRPAHVLSNLQDAVTDDPVLRRQLDSLLNPPVPDAMRRYEEKRAETHRKRKKEEKRKKQVRYTWMADLRANPDRVRNPPNPNSDKFTDDQYWLMFELQNRSSAADRSAYANWQALIPDFGEAVAQAYRDAAVNHWRYYLPNLRSEGAQSNSTPYSLIFAMGGLEMEATENLEFPSNLDEKQAVMLCVISPGNLTDFPVGWSVCIRHSRIWSKRL
jgi:hypothetical protein